MRIEPFLLDHWLTEHQFGDPPIEFDLAASTGPRWTWGELLTDLAPDALDGVRDAGVSYGPATGSPPVRDSVGEMAGVEPADVLVVTGASEALWMLLVVAAGPGANIVVPHPGYPAFDELARQLGFDLRHYHLRPEDEYRTDIAELDACVDGRTALVIVNTPHNPTGAVVPTDELMKLRDLAADRGAQLIADEVYHPIYHGATQPSAAPLPGVTTIGDLSKALCLSGLRIGWLIEHDRDRYQQYVEARSYLTISNSPINEALAAAAIRNRATILARAQSVAASNLAVLDGLFHEHAATIGWVRPAGGLTAFPWLRSGADSRPLCVDAAAAGVLVAPGDCFAVLSHFRIGFGAAERGFEEAVARLGGVIAKHA